MVGRAMGGISYRGRSFFFTPPVAIVFPWFFFPLLEGPALPTRPALLFHASFPDLFPGPHHFFPRLESLVPYLSKSTSFFSLPEAVCWRIFSGMCFPSALNPFPPMTTTSPCPPLLSPNMFPLFLLDLFSSIAYTQSVHVLFLHPGYQIGEPLVCQFLWSFFFFHLTPKTQVAGTLTKSTSGAPSSPPPQLLF